MNSLMVPGEAFPPLTVSCTDAGVRTNGWLSTFARAMSIAGAEKERVMKATNGWTQCMGFIAG